MDEREEYSTPANPEGIAKIIVFALIGMVLITSLVLPILTTLGEQTSEEQNTGVRMSCMDPGEWEKITEMYDPTPAPELYGAVTGLYVYGRINGVYTTTYLVHAEDYNSDYPVLFTNIHQDAGSTIAVDVMKVEYRPNAPASERYSLVSYSQDITTAAFQFPSPTDEISTSEIWYQDPKGDYVMNEGPMSFSGSDYVFGFYVERGLVLVSDLEQAMYYSDVVPIYGEPTVEKTTHNRDTTVYSIGYSDTECMYYIGPISYTASENYLENTPIGTMIGIIPTLMIIGIVIFIAKSVRRSDR